MAESIYTFYRVQPGTLPAEFGLDGVSVPVRAEKEREVFPRPDWVDPDLLVEELALFIRDQPEFAANYREILARLAYLTGIYWGREGHPDRAAYLLELGLAANPENLSLRINYGVALLLDGQREEALRQLQIVLVDPDVEHAAALRMLVARIHAENGQPEKGVEALCQENLAWPFDDSYLHYLGEMERRAGLKPAASEPAPEIVQQVRELIQKALAQGRQ